MFSDYKKKIYSLTILLKVYILHIYNTYYGVACVLASHARYRRCYLQKYSHFFLFTDTQPFSVFWGKGNFCQGKRKVSFDTFD